MSYTKSIHISELNHYRLKLDSTLKNDTIENIMDKILNEKFKDHKFEVDKICQPT